MLEDKIAVLINPKAKGNVDDPHLGDRLRGILSNHGTLFEINDVDDLPKIIDRVIESGYEYIVSFGGDGTLQKHKTAYIKKLADKNEELEKEAYLEGKDSSKADTITPAFFVPGRRGTVNYAAKDADINGSPEEIITKLIWGIRTCFKFETHPVQTLEVISYPEGQPDNITSLEYGFVFGAVGVTKFLTKYYGKEDTENIRRVSRYFAELTLDDSKTFERVRNLAYNIIDRLLREEDINRIRHGVKAVVQGTVDKIVKKVPLTKSPSSYLDNIFQIGFDRVAKTKRASQFLDEVLEATFDFYKLDRPDAIKAFRIIAKGLASLALGTMGFPTTYHHEIIGPEKAMVEIYHHQNGDCVEGKIEVLPYQLYNCIVASSMKINTIGIDGFYRLDKVNEDGRIHLFAGNEPYVSLAINFLKTFGGEPDMQLKNAHDCLIESAKIRLGKGELYTLDAELMRADDVLEIRAGPVLHIPKLFNGY